MIKSIKDNILKAALYLFVFAVAIGCSKHIGPDMPRDGKIPIALNLGGVYSMIPQTKAGVHPYLKDELKDSLPEGSTLRLIILKARPADGKSILLSNISEDCIERDKSTNEIKEIGFTYILRDTTGPQALNPCELSYTPEGLVESVVKETLVPYSVKASTNPNGTDCYCIAISPAKKLNVINDTLKTSVRNQETFLSTNNNWSQTQYSHFVIPSDLSKEAVITLNPLMHTTARIKITIKNGDFISDLQLGTPAIELDRVPTEPGQQWFVDKDDERPDKPTIFKNKDLNLMIGDAIAPQMGNNILYNRMYILRDNCKTTVVPKSEREGEDTHVNDDITIVAETTVLPMDARPTPMIIRLNLYVNQVPMQFQYQTGKNFEAGHSYDYQATIKLHDDEMYVATWQDVSWKTEVDPE